MAGTTCPGAQRAGGAGRGGPGAPPDRRPPAAWVTGAQEFSGTAASQAEAMHTAVTAAERTGDAMSFLRGQIDGVAQQAASLGGRAQQIGEILELINEIAAQTSLLALNAAIEAARA